VTEGQMKLYISEGNPHCIKALAVLELTGVKCDIEVISHEGEWLYYQCLWGTFCRSYSGNLDTVKMLFRVCDGRLCRIFYISAMS